MYQENNFVLTMRIVMVDKKVLTNEITLILLQC